MNETYRDAGAAKFAESYRLVPEIHETLPEPPLNENGYPEHQHVVIECAHGTIWLDIYDLKDHNGIDVTLFSDESDENYGEVPLGVFGMDRDMGRRDFGNPTEGDHIQHGHVATRLVVLLTDKQ